VGKKERDEQENMFLKRWLIYMCEQADGKGKGKQEKKDGGLIKRKNKLG
jgi:hypothetical protein